MEQESCGYLCPDLSRKACLTSILQWPFAYSSLVVLHAHYLAVIDDESCLEFVHLIANVLELWIQEDEALVKFLVDLQADFLVFFIPFNQDLRISMDDVDWKKFLIIESFPVLKNE